MSRTLNRLSALKAERTKQPGMYADGGGLYLRVAEGGSKQWIYRYVTNGRPRDMGIGPVHVFTLAEARERAREASKLRYDGIDPIAHKHAQRAAGVVEAAKAITFKQCAQGFIRDNEAGWTNRRHRHDWHASLTNYVYPVLGNLPIAAIDTALVLKTVKPIWERVPETASRVRGRIEAVIGWATVHGYRSGDNPARWSQHLEHALPARSDVAKVEHHAALPYDQVPAFLTKLKQKDTVSAACLQFIALTAARRSEATDATWSEIDLDKAVWTIPKERMKKGTKDHRVPLSAAAIAVLKDMAAIRVGDYVFPSRVSGRPVHGASVAGLAKRVAAGVDITTHGFRSSFRDWVAERTSYPREVAEAALAHAVPSQVEAAYKRTDFFDRRSRLMQAWADYCAKPAASGKVVPIRA